MDAKSIFQWHFHGRRRCRNVRSLMLAYENSHLSSLLAARDVSPGGTSVPLQFHTVLFKSRWWSTRKLSLLWPPLAFYNPYCNYFIFVIIYSNYIFLSMLSSVYSVKQMNHWTTDDVKSVQSLVRSSDWLTWRLCCFTYIYVLFTNNRQKTNGHKGEK